MEFVKIWHQTYNQGAIGKEMFLFLLETIVSQKGGEDNWPFLFWVFQGQQLFTKEASLSLVGNLRIINSLGENMVILFMRLTLPLIVLIRE